MVEKKKKKKPTRKVDVGANVSTIGQTRDDRTKIAEKRAAVGEEQQAVKDIETEQKKSKIMDQLIDPLEEAGVEKRGFLDVAKSVITSKDAEGKSLFPEDLRKGTIPLGISPATIKDAPSLLGKAEKAKGVITQTLQKINFPKTTLTQQRSFVGKETTSGVNKIFSATRETARRYPNNVKSQALSGSLLSKIGLSAGLIGVIGTYPFAGFIKEEALQTLSFGFKTANDNDDLEGMQSALDAQREILDPAGWGALFNKIPYANVLNQLKTFYDAARKKLEIDQRVFENKQSLKGG